MKGAVGDNESSGGAMTKQCSDISSVSARRKAEPAVRRWMERWCDNLESGDLRMKSAAR